MRGGATSGAARREVVCGAASCVVWWTDVDGGVEGREGGQGDEASIRVARELERAADAGLR